MKRGTDNTLYIMKKLLLSILILLPTIAGAQRLVYEKADSIKVMQLLGNAPEFATTSDYMYYFGKQFLGTKYVGKTLDRNKKEQLVINLSELDCTTFVENCMALSLCCKTNRRDFMHFASFIRQIRYRNGSIAYEKRNHYFTQWVQANEEAAFVKSIYSTETPFTALQNINLNFMSKHPEYYPQLVQDKSLVSIIAQGEQAISGMKVRYIPTSALNNSALLKKYIKNGDIIGLQTSKDGLDTSHLGIASWHADGKLHLLNASSIAGKVIDDTNTLYIYMKKQPSRIGIRVVRVL